MKYPRHGYSEYQNSVICYIDILGFEQLVQDRESHRIHYALEKIFKSLLKPTSRESFEYAQKMNNLSISQEIPSMIENGIIDISPEIQGNISYFSDTVMISFPIVEDKQVNIDKLQSLICKINSLFCRFFRKFESDLSIRGSITIGDIRHDGNFYYGPGLVEAYVLESKFASIPRVILSEKMTSFEWVQEALERSPFLDSYRDIDISKLDDNYTSISLLRIKTSSINLAFCDGNLHLNDFLKNPPSNNASYIWLRLIQMMKFIERSHKRVKDISNEEAKEKEAQKLVRISNIYLNSLEEIILASKETDPDLIQSFKEKFSINPEKYKDHSFDRRNVKLLINDPVHIYNQAIDKMPHFHGNCCLGEVIEILSKSKVVVRQKGAISINNKKLCDHKSSEPFEINTSFLEKEWKYTDI